MKLKPLFLAVALLLATQAFSQENEEQQTERKTPVSVWLNGGVGVGIADAYDKGVAPMSMWGLGVGGQLGVTVDWHRFHVQEESRALCGFLLKPISGFDIDVQNRVEFLYRFHDGKRDRLHLWAGGGLQEDAFFRIIPSLGNASTSTAVFVNLNAEAMIQYDFAFIKNHTHNLLTVYGKVMLPLGGLIVRPPYAFMDNYTSDINLLNTILSSYEIHGMAFPGVSTDLRLQFNLLNGNKIGLSYRWDYLTTRNKGHYRFDNAFHTISVDFMFKLN
jgi:hypothetical protein